MKKFYLFALLLLCLNSAALAAQGAGSPAAQLPKLDQALVLDGDLKEWGAAAPIPLLSEACIAIKGRRAKWGGPADAGMEAYFAWNDEGLCLAALVTDNEVQNDREGDVTWQRDCIQFFLDGRVGTAFMQPGVSKDTHAIMFRPPFDKQPAAVFLNSEQAKADGLKFAGRRTSTGYTAEMLVPWSAFPQLSPKVGSQIAIAFMLNDYDDADGQTNVPVMMSRGASKWLRAHPELYVKWKLGEKIQTEPLIALSLSSGFFAPGVAVNGQPIVITFTAGRPLFNQAGSVIISAWDVDRKLVLNRRVGLKPMARPWDKIGQADLEWSPDVVNPGTAKLSATLLDKRGRTIGATERTVLFIGDAVNQALAGLKKADLPRLSQTQPFKAAAYLGAGVAVEELKRAIEIEDIPRAQAAVQQIQARLSLLENGKVQDNAAAVFKVLDLAADPEAEVVVEYSGNTSATVSLNWGAIPLATVFVDQHPTNAEALKALARWQPYEGGSPNEAAIDGLPARVADWRPVTRPATLEDYQPDKQVLYANMGDRRALLVPVEIVSAYKPEAAAVLPDCPAAVKDALEVWAKKSSIPLTSPEAAGKKNVIMIAGDLRLYKDGESAKKFYMRSSQAERMFDGLSLVKDDRQITVLAPTREIAEYVARLVIACKPIKPSDMDALRLEVVKALAPNVQPAAPPKGTGLYCGDLHIHTFFSDGSNSPVGTALATMYCLMDYAAITDHDQIGGAQLAEKMLKKYGVEWPLAVGEEVAILNGTIHMNAYPIKEVISNKLELYDTIKAAHSQGAVMQWNHPGWPPTDWAYRYLNTGVEGTGFDAWEHTTDDYGRWKQTGVLPAMTGTSDTHNCMFGPAERTLILAPSPQGDDIAEAIRRKQVALEYRVGNFLYGRDDVLSVMWAALAEGNALKAAKAEQIKAALKNADIAGLLQASQPKAAKP